MPNYHYIQENILKKLLFAEKLNYAKLKLSEMESSHFAYHLDTLITDNLIRKDSKGIYSLTEKGKEIANSIDFDSELPNRQAKHSVVFCCKRKDQILVYKRLKNPFYSCQGFPTGKVQFGENIVDAVERELREETNLTGNPSLIGIRHYKVYHQKSNELLEDKVMYIYLIENPKGELNSSPEGEFIWIGIDDSLNNSQEEFEEIRELVKDWKGIISFKEKDHFTNRF